MTLSPGAEPQTPAGGQAPLDPPKTLVKTGAAVEFRGLRREFGDVKALDGLNLLIEPGELVAPLGPSGCGKTTALRVLAGLEQVDSGEVLVDGSDVVGVPANKRDMGMVFQAYSLFPNLTVLDNVAFGLRLRGQGTTTRQKRAQELLELVGPDTHAKRYPHQLSGGQQQRVALARALAIEPACCCSTSRCRRWTPRRAPSGGTRSGGSSCGSASRPCSSRTTRRRRCRSRTASA
jgi:putative spermidine/putrescine transport system ATP-binding protein